WPTQPAWSHRGRRTWRMITRVPRELGRPCRLHRNAGRRPGLPTPGDPRPRVLGRRGRTRDATMVSPSEGNEVRRKGRQGVAASHLSGDTNSDPLPPVLIPTPIMPSCYRLSTPLSGSFLVFTSVSRWVCSGSTFVNLDRINPLLRFSRSR